jgi:hypothetical protein
MNDARRKVLVEAIAHLEAAQAQIEQVGSEEQEAFDNLSEGLQQSERGQKMEEAANELSNAHDSLEDVISQIQAVME